MEFRAMIISAALLSILFTYFEGRDVRSQRETEKRIKFIRTYEKNHKIQFLCDPLKIESYDFDKKLFLYKEDSPIYDL